MNRESQSSAPGPEMVNAVAEMLRNLEQISSDPSIIGQCPELPGVVLDKVFASCLDREGSEYAKVNRDYQALRAHYFKALAAHPVGRARPGRRLDRSRIDGTRSPARFSDRRSFNPRQAGSRTPRILQLPPHRPQKYSAGIRGGSGQSSD